MTTITLKKPIQAHGEERRTIELREPTPADIMATGYPVRSSTGGTGPDPAVINALITRLGNIPLSSVTQLSMRDWNACLKEILGFFADAEEEETTDASSSEPSTLPTSGNGTLGTH